MEINITCRNFESDDKLKRYVQKRLDKLQKMYSRVYRTEIILGAEKSRMNAEIVLYLKSNRIVARETSPDIYASVDQAVENIKKQLRRLNGRLRSKRRKRVISNIMNPMSMFRADDYMPISDGRQSIIKTNTFADKPMLPEEAKLELAPGDNGFLMFKNSDTGEHNVIYKKKDGNYGLIEPKF